MHGISVAITSRIELFIVRSSPYQNPCIKLPQLTLPGMYMVWSKVVSMKKDKHFLRCFVLGQNFKKIYVLGQIFYNTDLKDKNFLKFFSTAIFSRTKIHVTGPHQLMIEVP